MKRIIQIALMMMLLAPLQAAPEMRVLALFKDKAMLEINGKRRLLLKGKRTPEGVVLLSSSGLRAVVEVGGKEITLEPKSRIGSNYAVPKGREIQIVRDNSGHFRANGTINGQSVSFLLDTGATFVAMSEVEARRLGIQYQLKGKPMMAQTASGPVQAYSVVLDSVSVGTIRKRNVKGAVVRGNSPHQVLLGMSFLGDLQMQNKGNLMILKSTR